jgi:hypothetical protein
MKIDNHTNWSTDDLRKLMTATLKKIGFKKINLVKIIYQRGLRTSIGGTCWYRHIDMIVPKPESLDKKFDTVRFVQVFTHEVHHRMGLGHGDMVSSYDIDCSWAKDFEVNLEVKIPKPKEPLVQRRYKHAKKMLKEKERTIRRNQNLAKKWKKKVRYYEKKIKK